MHRPLSFLLISLFFISCSADKYFVQEQQQFKLTVESVDWYLTFPDADLTPQMQKINPDRSAGYFMLSNAKTGLNVSFFIEPSNGCTSSESCRDRAWVKQKAALKGAVGVKLSSFGEAYAYEYLLPELFNQKNLNVHLYREGYWIDVHLSKIMYTPKDDDLFTDFISTLSFEAKPKPKK